MIDVWASTRGRGCGSRFLVTSLAREVALARRNVLRLAYPQGVASIEELIHRRSDLSTFLVHFTRDTDDGMTGRENLLSILTSNFIRARNAYGMARWHCGIVRRCAAAANHQRNKRYGYHPNGPDWFQPVHLGSETPSLPPGVPSRREHSAGGLTGPRSPVRQGR